MNNEKINVSCWTGGGFICSSCCKMGKKGIFTWFESYRGVSARISMCDACAKDYANKLIKESEKSIELARATFYEEDNNERR